MKRFLIALLICIAVIFTFVQKVQAVEDPLAVPNNMVGVHILFPSEISDAAGLVNSTKGDWGYVTIPVQSGDKNIKKCL